MLSRWHLAAGLIFLFIRSSYSLYTNDLVLELDHDDIEKAQDLAQKHGLRFKGRVFANHFHYIHPKVRRRSVVEHDVQLIREDSSVLWMEQQKVKTRSKRDYEMSDPLYHDMWYIDPKYQNRNAKEVRHMNITAAWEMGYSGKGVVVSILDDGIEMKHPDLAQNYDKEASWDVNSDDDDPTPHYNSRNDKLQIQADSSYTTGTAHPPMTDALRGYVKEINRHGTRCAGEVAATANNGHCVPGVAYNAKVGGVRMLDGDVTDLVEAKSIGHNQGHVDIYSASWGPDDDGRTVDGPAKLAIKAFKDGALTGRGGKGNIFVWASGNGGRYDDNCNCDGYTNSIYTISISSTSELEKIPWYSEFCVSTLASTYSSGGGDEKQIITTDLRGMCTAKHTGTSASAPIAAAIIALALEANPQLTWRDVQHILVRTSQKHHLNAPDWKQNAMGRWFSGRYGYGLMDAGAIVEAAKNWVNVGAQNLCELAVVMSSNVVAKKGKITEKGNTMTVGFDYESSCEEEITSIEHITVVLTLTPIGKRGELEFVLKSPMGTNSKILAKRSHDYSSSGFSNYEFLTVEMWDEDPNGHWELVITNFNSKRSGSKVVNLKGLDIRIRGTAAGGRSKEEPPTIHAPIKATTEEITTFEATTKKAATPKPTTKTTTKKPTTTTTTTTTTTVTTTKVKTTTKTTTSTTTSTTTTTTTTTTESTTEEETAEESSQDDSMIQVGHQETVLLIALLLIGCPLFYLLMNKCLKPGKSSKGKYHLVPSN